jgi:hypothetical protein
LTPLKLTSQVSVVLVALALAACGGGSSSSEGTNAKKFSGSEQDVAQVVDDLQSAAKDGDGQKICDDIFDASLKQSVTKAASGDCASAVVKPLKNTTFTVTGVTVKGNTAVARVNQSTGGKATIAFRKSGGDWKMTGSTPATKKAIPAPQK